MKKIAILLMSLLVVMALTAYPAASAVTYIGEIHSPTSVQGSGVWINPGITSLSWIVSNSGAPGALWHYSYTLNVPQQNITHWILQLTPGVNQYQIHNITGTTNPTFGLFTHNSVTNPGLPIDLYGMEIENVNALTQTVTFDTSIAPVWGNFYANNGVTNGVNNFAFNSTITDPNPTEPPSNGALDCKVLRPDSPVVPEPSSVMLGAMGLLPFIITRRRLRKS